MKIKTWNPDGKLYKQSYETMDFVGKILRISFEIERHVEFIMPEIAPDVQLSKVPNLSHRIQILRAMRLPKKLIELLEEFTNLRNKLAHDPRVSMSDCREQIKRIIRLGSQAYDKIEGAIVTFSNDKEEELSSYKYSEMSDENKLVYIGSMAVSVLAAIPQTREFSDPKVVVKFNNLNW